jgi:4-diphosphocytidyl-2-C-methyl-D-erythritol kinase
MPDATPWSGHVKAWGKVNLFLRILAREASGFHQLETLFQRIALADTVQVTVQPGAGIALLCDRQVGVPDEQNLAWRAAAAYRQSAAWPRFDHQIAIDVAKDIPTGAGLGGGSADAGAVLRILNALNPAPLSASALLPIAATLGADVPFLSTDAALALAWGRGERMLALAPLPQRMIRLAEFRTGVNTAQAYGALAAARAADTLATVGSDLLPLDALASWADVSRYARNDFEGPVFAMRPDIAQVHASMSDAAPGALVRMSGSGATVFAVTDMHGDALSAAALRWPADNHVALRASMTLETVPPVQILSAPAGPR